jgi:NitT/TauT family transport system substrate-binding protein
MRVLSSNLGKALLGGAVAALALGSSAQAQELMNVNFMSSNHQSCSPYPQMVAQSLGIWEDLGIKVTLLNTQTSVPYVAFLQNGDADIAMLDSAQVLQGADAGLPIKIVYVAYQFAPEEIIVPADSPIQGLADLRDKTVGMASDRDLITTVIAVDSIGETLQSMNVTTVVVGDSGPVMASALQNNTIQAFAGGASDRAGIEAAGIKTRSITPAEVSRNPGNSLTVWGPTLEEKRDMISAFVKGWAMAQHTGVLETKVAAAGCRVHVPEVFENLEIGMNLINNGAYRTQVRRTKLFGELQPDVWAAIQGPYVKLGEISKEIDPSTFLDDSFIDVANDFTTDDVKAKINAWKEANPDKLIN